MISSLKALSIILALATIFATFDHGAKHDLNTLAQLQVDRPVIYSIA